jgi:ATP synthase F1 gamma subunit
VRNPRDIATEQFTMGTVVNLTSVFETLASMKISQTKNQVLQSQQFFDSLWAIYGQIRLDKLFRFGRVENDQMIDKELLIVLSGEGGFSGDLDQRLINMVVKQYDAEKQDIIILGHHGAMQLTQAHISFKKYFKLPVKDSNINVMPLIHEVRQYRNTAVYYQSYVSLMTQDVKRIELGHAVEEAGSKEKQIGDVISELTYIFEPSTYAVAAQLERSMLEITLSQVILDSKLAQYASRFRAMSMAHSKANESYRDLGTLYNRTKRAVADERLKETISGMKKLSND